MLVGLAGRQFSGKSTAAGLLLNRGFQKASFAAALKDYVGKLYNWSLEDLNSQEGKMGLLPNPVIWDKNACLHLSKIASVDLFFEEERVFHTRREALQYVGTDVLRKHDEQFHLKEFNRRFSNGDFVCDDLRFPNELDMLKNMGAICCYIMRPYFWNYSNHDSEVSLRRNHFDYVYLNDRGPHKLERQLSMFFDNMLVESTGRSKKRLCDRKELIHLLKECGDDTTKCANVFGCSRDLIVWWASSYMIPISQNTYPLDHDAFSIPTFENAYWAGLLSADGSIKRHLKHDFLLELTSDDFELIEGFQRFLKTDKPHYSLVRPNGKTRYSLTVSSPYLIEDLKLWNVEPLKSKYNKIPDCIRNNDELMSQWLVGLIDGDGSIFNIKQTNNIGLTILASKQIIEFVKKWLNLNGGCVSSEKGIDNLFNLKFVGKNAVAVYRKIYRGIGLERKWGKFLPYLEKYKD